MTALLLALVLLTLSPALVAQDQEPSTQSTDAIENTTKPTTPRGRLTFAPEYRQAQKLFSEAQKARRSGDLQTAELMLDDALDLHPDAHLRNQTQGRNRPLRRPLR